MRKPIQISMCVTPDNYVLQTVICDDGTMWHSQSVNSQWEPLPPIPQDELCAKKGCKNLVKTLGDYCGYPGEQQ